MKMRTAADADFKSPSKIAPLFVAVLPFAVPLAWSSEKPLGNEQLEYVNAERTSSFQFSGAEVWVGPIAPQKNSDTGALAYEHAGSEVADCSNSEYRCKNFGWWTIALPRSPLRERAAYTYRGNVFTVLQCLRSASGRCQVALIQADCQERIISERQCRPVQGGRGASSELGPVGFYIYNEDFGITSFGFFDGVEVNTDAIGATARTYVLQGYEGLLKPE